MKFLLKFCVIINLLTTITGRTSVEPLQFKKNDKIYGGFDDLGENSKHIVSIRLKKLENIKYGLGHFCGGSLITENAVLSAAHCFMFVGIYNTDGTYEGMKHDDVILAIGTLYRYSHKENASLHESSAIVCHKDFNYNSRQHDIAIVLLTDSVPMNRFNIKPIPLATSHIPKNTKCQISGWGEIAMDKTPDMLQTANIHIYDKEHCLAVSKKIKSGMFCAGGIASARDACNQDSGGPLYCNGLLVGITSWGWECFNNNNPGVYTDVVHYFDWIEQILEDQFLYMLAANDYTKLRNDQDKIQDDTFLIIMMVIFAIIFGIEY